MTHRVPRCRRGAFATTWAFLTTEQCGTVIAVGSDITHTTLGDRVYGAQKEMCPRTPDQGAFAQYTITCGRIWGRVPDNGTTGTAAAFPPDISTAGLALKLLDIPLPYTSNTRPSKTIYVLVYSGSTATATINMLFLREYVAKPHRFPTMIVKYRGQSRPKAVLRRTPALSVALPLMAQST
jgi:NADPH:quinone reductase-like Zn-dependent oxidoreductase